MDLLLDSQLSDVYVTTGRHSSGEKQREKRDRRQLEERPVDDQKTKTLSLSFFRLVSEGLSCFPFCVSSSRRRQIKASAVSAPDSSSSSSDSFRWDFFLFWFEILPVVLESWLVSEKAGIEQTRQFIGLVLWHEMYQMLGVQSRRTRRCSRNETTRHRRQRITYYLAQIKKPNWRRLPHCVDVVVQW